MIKSREWLGLISLCVAIVALLLTFEIAEVNRKNLRALAEAVNPNILVFRPNAVIDQSTYKQLREKFNGAVGLDKTEMATLRAIEGVKRISKRGSQFFVMGKEFRIVQIETDAKFVPLLNLQLEKGKNSDSASRIPSAVIGSITAREYFGQTDPIGKPLDTGYGLVRVTGVLKPIPKDLLELRSLDAAILLTSDRSNARPMVFTGFIEFEAGQGSAVQARVEAALKTFEIGALYTVVTAEQWLGRPYVFRREVAASLGQAVTWTVLLAVLAAMANLLNLFALRVWNRLPTLAVQRAVGATQQHILIGVLLDVLRLGLLASLAGVTLYVLLLPVLQKIFADLQITPLLALLAVLLGVGMAGLAGLLPAFWAAKLPVVTTLREKPKPLFREAIGLLGVVVGVAALLTSISISQGATAWVNQRIEELGGRRVVYSPITGPFDQIRSIRAKPPVDYQDFLAMPNSLLEKKAFVYNDAIRWDLRPPNWDATAPKSRYYEAIFRVTPSYFDFAARKLVAGKYPQAINEMVIGEDFLAKWFGKTSPQAILGQQLTFKQRVFTPNPDEQSLETRVFTVVGVFRGGGWETFGDIFGGATIALFNPKDAEINLLRGDLHLLIAKQQNFEQATAQLNQFLTKRLPGLFAPAEAVYPAGDMQPIRVTLEQTALGYAAFACLTLLIGGFGLAMVMLVRVGKRRNEIALRRAVGATAQSIQQQFLLESAKFSILGGSLGLGFGLFGTWLVALASPWHFFIVWQILPVALMASLLIGLGFGWHPAFQAAKIAPAEGLRTGE